MKKIASIFMAFVMMVVCAVSFTGCGVDMTKVTGEWTIDTIDGKSVEDYAAENSTFPYAVVINLSINEETAKTTSAGGTVDYKVVQRSNGVELTNDNGDVQMTVLLEGEVVSSDVDFGFGQVKAVFKKGTADIDAMMADATAVEEIVEEAEGLEEELEGLEEDLEGLEEEYADEEYEEEYDEEDAE